MAEIQRDLGSSYEAGLLSVPGREFIREGCLRKLSRKGYQQRMFFLVSERLRGRRISSMLMLIICPYLSQFSDLLLYSNRTTNPTLHFRVHGALPVRELSGEFSIPSQTLEKTEENLMNMILLSQFSTARLAWRPITASIFMTERKRFWSLPRIRKKRFNGWRTSQRPRR